MATASSSSAASGNPVNGHKEPRPQAPESDSDSGEEEIEEGEDEAWEDWVEGGDEDGSEGGATLQATHSLFNYEKVLPGPEEALEYDKEESGCDFVAVVARLCTYNCTYKEQLLTSVPYAQPSTFTRSSDLSTIFG